MTRLAVLFVIIESRQRRKEKKKKMFWHLLHKNLQHLPGTEWGKNIQEERKKNLNITLEYIVGLLEIMNNHRKES